jgi:hypothetical protein
MFFEIKFDGVEQIKRLSGERAVLLRTNAETAVARTVLLGVTRIAGDCPVDTGRARASLAGDLAGDAGIPLEDSGAAEGANESLTAINGLEGRIGSNVEYVPYLEYGYRVTGPKKLTEKQRKYLFASGILKSVGGRVIPGSIHTRINRRAGLGGGRVKGKGFFRKNIPIIKRYFDQTMEKAVEETLAGHSLRRGE